MRPLSASEAVHHHIHCPRRRNCWDRGSASCSVPGNMFLGLWMITQKLWIWYAYVHAYTHTCLYIQIYIYIYLIYIYIYLIYLIFDIYIYMIWYIYIYHIIYQRIIYIYNYSPSKSSLLKKTNPIYPCIYGFTHKYIYIFIFIHMFVHIYIYTHICICASIISYAAILLTKLYS